MPKNILIVEDYEDSRTMLKFLLESWGYKVVEAENGREAIERVEQKLPDLILMDMSLPEVDGLSATRKIKKLANAEKIPIICVTAHGHYYEEKAKEAGCKTVVPKPIDFEILEKIISQYLKED
jgi:CheY-like chemotaxis protein